MDHGSHHQHTGHASHDPLAAQTARPDHVIPAAKCSTIPNVVRDEHYETAGASHTQHRILDQLSKIVRSLDLAW